MGDLRLDKHPEKTLIGRIQRGFDFLGYHFSPKGLTSARETQKRFVSRATRLYEQEAGVLSIFPTVCRELAARTFKRGQWQGAPLTAPSRGASRMSGAPSALRGIHRQGVRNRNDILLLSVVYSLSYEEAGREAEPESPGDEPGHGKEKAEPLKLTLP